ncbi:MAG: Plug domain-containing protein, partial [Flavobacteriales bacterium]
MKYFCLISLVFISSFGYSQSYKVTVVDENNIAIPFVATEIIYSVNSEKKSKQTITNGNGLFFIDTAWKEVRLRLKHISYQTKFTSVSAINNKVTLYLDQTELTDFVVTGQYAPSSDENTSHKVRVIDSKRIEAQGAVTLQELMEQEMNIRVSQDNVLGASMSVQGLSGENVKILIDGVPVVGRLNGSVD